MRFAVIIVAVIAAALSTPGLRAAATQAKPESVAATGRVVTSLNAFWRFKKGDEPGVPSAEFDDSKWAQVTLPHTFNGSDGDDGGSFYRGPGWYRRTLTLRSAPVGRAYLEFDGAALVTEATVNGIRVGAHAGGHARFRFDVTKALRPGSNVIAVRVDNTRVPEITPLGGDFTLFGGLYRGVQLIETGNSHIELMDHGGPGARVVTRSLSNANAEIDVVTTLRNDGVRNERVSLTVSIEDGEGRLVGRATRREMLRAGQHISKTVPLLIASPRRWNGRKDPHLYRVTSEVRALDGALQDSIAVPLGLRTFAFDAQKGFLLNDRPYPLYGVNMFHSGRPGRGLAVTDAEIAVDMQILDELGVTAIRFVHFQHSQQAYEEANRRGIVIWTEIGLNGASDPGAGFAANVSQQMRELIRQNYNHPSVVLWGLGNEVYATTPDVTRILQTVQAVAKSDDPSRPTIYAHCCQADDHEKAQVSDVIAFNRYFGWYPGQEGTLGQWADKYHGQYPLRPVVVGEYGAGGSILHQMSPPPTRIVTTSGWHPEQFQTEYHETNWPQLAARPYLGGNFIWVAFDLASDGRGEGDRPGINDKGIITYDRAVRKDAYYYYQAHWSPKPMVHIADRRLVGRTETLQEVKVYSNVEELALFVNGSRVGVARPVGRIARWTGIRLQPGDNRVEVRGQGVSDAVEWTLVQSSPTGASAIPEVNDPEQAIEVQKAPPGQ